MAQAAGTPLTRSHDGVVAPAEDLFGAGGFDADFGDEWGDGAGFDDEPFVTTPWHPDTPFHRGCVPKRKAPSFAPKTLMSR